MSFLGFPAVFLGLSPSLLSLLFTAAKGFSGHLITVLMAGHLAHHRWSLVKESTPYCYQDNWERSESP